MNYRIGFVGAGKVGFSLGKYFSTKGINVVGYYSKNYSSSKEASIFTNSNCFNSLKELLENCDLIFITTPDDNIDEIWQNLKVLNLKNKIVCHTSGSYSSTIFSDINTSGAYGYSIHPLYPFSDKFTTYKNLTEAYFSIEGNPILLNDMKSFIESLGNPVILIDSENKPLYHLANVTVSNLVLSILDLGTNYLESCNVPKETALKALMPLIEANIHNVKSKGFEGALTGPIERCDTLTIKKHLQVIPNEDKFIYNRLSLNLLKLATKKNKGRETKYNKLRFLLGG